MSGLLSLGGWYILPDLVTGWIQTAYYAIWIRAGDPKPPVGSRRFLSDRKKIRSAVIAVYLLYTIYEADWDAQRAGDCYRDLGVDLDVNERGLQSRFRRLTVQYHPDKVPADERSTADMFYVQLKSCRDTLLDPAKRFAYDRFGPDIARWQNSSTITDYVFVGLRNSAMFYTGFILILLLLGVVGHPQQGTYWRYWTLVAMFVLELHTLTRPSPPGHLVRLINPLITSLTSHRPYLQFQALMLARKIMLSFFIAMSQIRPLFATPGPGGDDKKASKQKLDRLDAVVKISDQEVTRLTQLELTPFLRDEVAMADLRASIKTWLVDNAIKSNQKVQAVVMESVRRRHADATR